jgi:hypothetical protein
MSLPKIEYPIFLINIPSLNKKIKFRPFLVKEEKILLMAKESDDLTDVLSATKQVINNCCLEQLDINKLAIFDLEYIFLKLRALSVDDKIKLTYTDNEDNQPYTFEVDLNSVEIKFPENINNNIKLTDTSGIIMKYPSASLYDDKEFMSADRDQLFQLIIKCLDKFYEDDNVYEFKDYKHKDIEEFLDNLNIKIFEQIQTFLINTPKLNHVIEYKNSLGNNRKIELSSLNDFFM